MKEKEIKLKSEPLIVKSFFDIKFIIKLELPLLHPSNIIEQPSRRRADAAARCRKSSKAVRGKVRVVIGRRSSVEAVVARAAVAVIVVIAERLDSRVVVRKRLKVTQQPGSCRLYRVVPLQGTDYK